jgi:hypothetical protein
MAEAGLMLEWCGIVVDLVEPLTALCLQLDDAFILLIRFMVGSAGLEPATSCL